ncbi:nucleotidyltransferase family protein [Runella sp. SP2]|uniref:nucleotidyltransferase family protein n=1 Tax=Runella sp. SP2 TaxID=2268026 RepID=UPI000F08FB6A|nr:nucleotidyltransferase domain-containing protein [Runella sp. SP2]AYQ35905.1 DNA polymerase beta domain protein region [Runella sp. SP2]
MQSLTTIIQYLESSLFFQTYNLEKIGIFGSVAREEDANDLDLLIDGDPSDFKKWVQFKEKIEADLAIKVDIMFEKYADPIILYRAKKDLIYATRH